MIRSGNYHKPRGGNLSIRERHSYLDEDFDQDELSGRYGNSRDRQVPVKLRESRSKPRQWSRAAQHSR